MASIFCPDCGAKAAYTLNKPKFCQSCGIQFGKVSTASTATHEPETQEEENIPSLDKLEYSIDLEDGHTTLGDLFNNPIDPGQIDTSSVGSPQEGRKRKKQSKTDFLAKSMAECASSRKPHATKDGA
jgi:hypothetical protein